jgi:hypothetical protein
MLFHEDIRTDDSSNSNYCNTLWSCFVYTFDYGLRCPGGVGDKIWLNLETSWWLQFSWFMVVLVVIFNVVSGIIIMTFANLRDDKFLKEKDIHGRCFMCGIEKDVFEKNAGGPEGFKDHIKRDQNMWNYLYFIIFIWEQDKDDDDGLEYYVRNCIDRGDLTWFPINQAMCLKRDEDSNKKLISEVQQDLKVVDQSLLSNINVLKTEISASVENIIESLLSFETKTPNYTAGRSTEVDGQKMSKSSSIVMSSAGGFVSTSRVGSRQSAHA